MPDLEMKITTETGAYREQNKERVIKCLVWDLDNTLWQGTLLENDQLSLSEGAAAIIQSLDQRGILQSIASKNDHELAMKQLEAFGLSRFFLYPQINWNSKADSIKKIAAAINIGLDAIAFIDDQPFERDEVAFSLPQVMCIDAADLPDLLAMPAMNPRFLTADARMRRRMMLAAKERQEAEESFSGPQEAFLSQLQMRLSIFPAGENDLQRAEELTVRTNQLNATGYTYSYEELDYFRQSENHLLLMARLEDKYGAYGHIGLALVECGERIWTIKLLLMSCRVMSRGVGGVLLSTIMRLAKKAEVSLQADFVPTDRNRMMLITYRFSGFNEIAENEGRIVFAHNLSDLAPYPDYMAVELHEAIR